MLYDYDVAKSESPDVSKLIEGVFNRSISFLFFTRRDESVVGPTKQFRSREESFRFEDWRSSDMNFTSPINFGNFYSNTFPEYRFTVIWSNLKLNFLTIFLSSSSYYVS